MHDFAWAAFRNRMLCLLRVFVLDREGIVQITRINMEKDISSFLKIDLTQDIYSEARNSSEGGGWGHINNE